MSLDASLQAALEAAQVQAAEGSAQALSGLLGRGVSVSPTGVSALTAPELSDKFFTSVAQIPVTLGGQAKGKAIVAFNESAAALMADLVIGGDGSNPPDALSDLHLQAVSEVAGQLADAMFSGLGLGLERTINVTAGELGTMQPGELPSAGEALGGSLTVLEFSLEIEGGLPSPMLAILSGAAVASLSGGAPAPASAPSKSSARVSGGSMDAPVVQAAQLSQLTGTLPEGVGNNLELLMDVPLQITVELGRTQKMVKEVLALGPGSVLELDKLAGEPVDILVNERPIAKGEVVVIDENFGIRVTEILSPKDRVSF